MCVLKSSIDTADRDDMDWYANTLDIEASKQSASWSFSSNTHVPGYSIHKISNGDLSACESACMAMSKCTGFVNKRNKAMCVLTSSIDTADRDDMDWYANTLDIEASRQSASWSFSSNTQVPGYSIHRMSNEDLSACESECMARSKCTGFVNKRNKAMCVLKSSIDTADRDDMDWYAKP